MVQSYIIKENVFIVKCEFYKTKFTLLNSRFKKYFNSIIFFRNNLLPYPIIVKFR